MATVVTDTLPRLSLGERDRKHAAIREQLKARGVDCVVVGGSNLFYLTNGLPGERFGLLPTAEDLPLMAVLNGRHLADVSPRVLVDAQEWVKDIRAGNDASPLVDRINELGLEHGMIGLGDSPSNVSHGFSTQLRSALPSAQFVDVSDIFANLRTTKSEEEIAMIAQANRIFDACIDAVYEVSRPGMSGSAVVQAGIRAMWEAGGDLDSTFGFNFGAVPKQNPILAHLCLATRIQPGDIGTLTAHAEYCHYAGHTDQEISFGQPKQLHREMFEAVRHVREQVLKQVKAGNTHDDLQEAYRKACAETGFRSSSHSQIHQYGIDVPEFPGPAFLVGGGEARGGRGRANFVLAPGMIYSISPTLVAPEGEDTLLGGTSISVTETGYRELTDRKVELLVVAP